MPPKIKSNANNIMNHIALYYHRNNKKILWVNFVNDTIWDDELGRNVLSGTWFCPYSAFPHTTSKIEIKKHPTDKIGDNRKIKPKLKLRSKLMSYPLVRSKWNVKPIVIIARKPISFYNRTLMPALSNFNWSTYAHHTVLIHKIIGYKIY